MVDIDTGEAASDLTHTVTTSSHYFQSESAIGTALLDGVRASTTESTSDISGAAVERTRPKPIKVLRASGKAAPDFDLTLLNGGSFRLSDHLGKVVVLNFWGSWCPPCRWEMPDFQEMYQEYRDDGVVFVGIAVPPDDEEDARAFTEKIGVTYPVGLDPEGELLIKYRVTSFPTTYLIDREGTEQRKFGIANKAVLKLFLKSGLLEG